MFSKKKKEQSRSIALIQGGLNTDSTTDILIAEAVRLLTRRGIAHHIIDVRNKQIDFWDGRPQEKYSPETQEIGKTLGEASAYIFGVPIYAAKISGAVKNIIALAGQNMEKKAVGIMASSLDCAPYPATHELIGILSDRAHVPTVQPVVYATREEFKDGKIFDEQLSLLIEEMIDALIKRWRVG